MYTDNMMQYRLLRRTIKSVNDKGWLDAAEDVWAWVQRHNGEMAIHRHYIEFFIDPKYSTMLHIICPHLVRI